MYRSRRTRRPVFIAALVALCIGLAACGNALGSTENQASGTSSAPSDTLTIGLSRQITGLDPANSGSLDSDATIQAAIFSGLTKIDPDQKLVGDLAESWQQTSDTEWVFTIRKGVTFSNGDPFDATTAKWNFDRVLDKDGGFSQGASLGKVIASVDAPDPTTLVITTKAPFLDLDDRLANFFFTEEQFVSTHNPKIEALGTGPYELVSVDLENGAVLKRNPKYFGTAPEFENVKYLVLANEAARVSAAQTGEVDIAIQYEPTSLSQFADSDVYRTGNQWSSWNMTLRFNETNPALQDVRVRQALNYAVDKDTIVKNVLGADIEPLQSQVVSAPYDTVNPALKAYPYDPEKAKALLAAAGQSGLTLELNLSTGTYVASDTIAQAISDQLSKVGVTVNITTAQFPAWVDRSRTPQVADLIYIGYTSGYKAPAERLRIFTSTNAQSHFADPEYDALIDQLTVATTREQQQEIFNQATALAAENPHVLFLWPQPLTYLIKKNLDWTPRPEHWLLPQDIHTAS